MMFAGLLAVAALLLAGMFGIGGVLIPITLIVISLQFFYGLFRLIIPVIGTVRSVCKGLPVAGGAAI